MQAQFGLHALLTCSNETLDYCNQEMKKVQGEIGVHGGFHIHVAEGTADQKRSVERCNEKVVARMEQHLFNGINQEKTILAHCIDLSDEEIAKLGQMHVNIAHNPSSNMNNAVGVTKVNQMLEQGINLMLGTDGMSSDMVMEHKTLYLLHKHN